MDEILICDEGEWSVVGGSVGCTGTIVSVTTDEFLSDFGLITQETWEAFYPWALLMFATAFGVKLMRKLIYSRG